ncbi:MAG TPA: hypothetical protein VK178_18810 [Opitutaceae bacterium]|nr:hypothetical protein [Opitutaceae bacterium]
MNLLPMFSTVSGVNPGKLALNRAEAAEVLGVTLERLDQFVFRGLLHPSRAFRRPLFPVWELERFRCAMDQQIAS